jgi:predicted phosphate transport protein (TIGR00153 family)
VTGWGLHSELPRSAGEAKPLPTNTGLSKRDVQSGEAMFNWFQALLPRTSDFFGMFERHAATLVAAADALSELAAGHSPPQKHIAEINRYEHEADDVIRQVLRSVRQTFLTPFDRGAITSLIGAMDDSIDEMQDTARAISLYELERFEPEMKRMVEIIVQAAALTAEAIPMLRDISRNGPKIHTLTEKLVQLESDADVVHAAGLKKAFQEHSHEPMQFMVAREIYKHLERITDAFEDVANEIDGIVIDHA